MAKIVANFSALPYTKIKLLSTFTQKNQKQIWIFDQAEYIISVISLLIYPFLLELRLVFAAIRFP